MFILQKCSTQWWCNIWWCMTVHLLFPAVFYIFNHISVSSRPINMFLGAFERGFKGLQIIVQTGKDWFTLTSLFAVFTSQKWKDQTAGPVFCSLGLVWLWFFFSVMRPDFQALIRDARFLSKLPIVLLHWWSSYTWGLFLFMTYDSKHILPLGNKNLWEATESHQTKSDYFIW